ncbi:MAG: SDR family NAD(P)-dependent oxidoreductase [Alphaproteobacteria bacterium]|nr:SDR family NAD(P)-dependent oxidoreductase [Alphaproteobacteria bacterium]
MNEGVTRAALITGGGTGIGAHIARLLSEQGVAVSLCGRRIERCREVADEIAGGNGKAVSIACDVSDYGEAVAAVEKTVSAFGRLDAVINNAGILAPEAMIVDGDPAAWARNISVNLTGPFNMVRAALPHLTASDDAVVVNVSSGAAHKALPGWSAYCAAKAGLAMFSQCLHLEHGPKTTGGVIEGEGAVRIYSIAPGTVWTAMQEALRKRKVNEVAELSLAALHSPARPAHVIAWLTTPEAADLAGQDLTVHDDALRARAGVPPELEIAPGGPEKE